jgi:hypothetical protein
MTRGVLILVSLLLTGCAAGTRPYTCGHVPRDQNGQPVVEAIGRNNC